ncbi:MAG: type II toxin-antitoxin system RelE/ParE family toxin [Bacteroidota bacterium]
MATCAFHPRATKDLDDIWYFIAREDVAAADRMIDAIRARCELAALFPHSGQRQDHLLTYLRRVIVGPYLVFYLPVPDGISVLRILHGKRDIDRLFD